VALGGGTAGGGAAQPDATKVEQAPMPRETRGIAIRNRRIARRILPGVESMARRTDKERRGSTGTDDEEEHVRPGGRLHSWAMGQHFQFRCESCTYQVEVSGGPDVGRSAATQTIACTKCKSLFDVVTSKDPGNSDAPTFPLQCPKGRPATHRVSPWNGGDPCPRCSAIMTVRREVFTTWD
jgi:hypothetical protein